MSTVQPWHHGALKAIRDVAAFQGEKCGCGGNLAKASVGDDGSKVTSVDAVFPALATLFGPLAATAESAYDAATGASSTTQIAAGRPVSPADVDISAAQNSVSITPAQAAYDAGVAAAAGTARVLTGDVPAPRGDLTPAQEAARVIVHGLSNAPAATTAAVVQQMPPSAMAGVARARMESATAWVLPGLGVLLALALGYWVFSDKTRDDEPTGRTELMY